MNKILIAVAFSAAFVAISASAAEPYAPARVYVGAGGGVADTDDHNTSYKIFGGVQASTNIGIEAAYNDFGGYRGHTAESWSVAMTGTIPLDKNWDVFGKLGLTENHTQYAGSSRRNDLLAGVGIGYNATKNVSVRVEYEDFGNLPDDPNGSSTKVTNLGMNMKYTF